MFIYIKILDNQVFYKISTTYVQSNNFKALYVAVCFDWIVKLYTKRAHMGGL